MSGLGDALGPPDPTIAPLLLRTFTEDDLAKYAQQGRVRARAPRPRRTRKKKAPSEG